MAWHAPLNGPERRTLWPGSWELFEQSRVDGEEEAGDEEEEEEEGVIDMLTSSLTSSVMSLLHHHHQTTTTTTPSPPGHLHHADTSDPVPDISKLWLTGIGIRVSIVFLTAIFDSSLLT